MLYKNVLLLFSLLVTIDASHRKSRIVSEEYPKLTLPWGTYQGQAYGESGETVLFQNIRFAKPPTGERRFAAPEYPDAIQDPNKIQDSSFGPNCIQAAAKIEVSPERPTNGTQHEDCLFLDVYAPAWAFEPDAEKLPVIVWIFGGAYIFGGKNTTFKLENGPFSAYDGQGIRDLTDNGVIWVTGNYRLGAYGFLAGSSMEKNAQPNAGLHDQRLLLDWVQKYIGKVGGDKNAVNVWGLSAGGGSILHHLTAYGGAKKEEPLFERAAIWSPAFQWSYDRAGVLQDTFDNFTSAAKCSKGSDALKCLRKADEETLRKANQDIVSQRLALGMFPFGPAVDGDLVPDLPAVLLKKGKHVKISSFMLSHDLDEASLFLANWVETEADFTKFVSLAFPGEKLSGVRKDIETQYPSKTYDGDQRRRTRTVLRDSTFVCNNHQLYRAYKKSAKVYASRYEIPPAQHGSDMLPIIWNQAVDVSSLIKAAVPLLPGFLSDILGTIFVPVAVRYQRYFAGHALAGDPNLLRTTRDVNWEVANDDGEELTNAMLIGLLYSNPAFYRSGSDGQVSTTNCDFWDKAAETITNVMSTGQKKPVSFTTQFLDRLRGVKQIEL